MSINSRPFTAIAAVVFALVAIGHLLRAVFGLEFVVGDFAVPLSVSVVATIIAGGLSLMVWRESRG
jgi:hypothetical protein